VPGHEQVKQVAAFAHGDEAGQLAVSQGDEVNMAALDISAQALLIIFTQEGRGSFGRKLVHDKLPCQFVQQTRGRRDIGWFDRTNQHSSS
jgi:hypothetical protein